MAVCKPVAVFLGPSLPVATARQILDADTYPPASMGDLYRAAVYGRRAMLLIDGTFHGTPSVWQREIMDVMSEGIRVVGASSMGALRAAELHRFGMIGCGAVFAWYRDGIIDGDDEVALLHGVAEQDYCAFSEPLVNIRCTLRRAVEAGCLPAEAEAALIAYAKAQYYPDRSYPALLDSPAARRALSEEQRAALAAYIQAEAVDVKRQDALSALRYLAEQPAGWAGASWAGASPAPTQPRGVWQMRWEMTPALHGRLACQHGFVSGGEVLAAAKRDADLVARLRPELSRRCFILEWAAAHGITSPESEAAAFTESWAKTHGVDREGAWLAANGLLPATCRRLLGDLALVDWLVRQEPACFGLAWPDSPPADAERPAAMQQLLVCAWAQDNGVSGPAGPGADQLPPLGLPPLRRGEIERGAPHGALADWIVEQGPAYFGRAWEFDVALLRELQITGQAAQLIVKTGLGEADHA